MKLLEGKVAVVYGAGGWIGSATAKAFASEGAFVYLTGRTLKPLEKLATGIAKSGGEAYASSVDALDPISVQKHLDKLIKKSGKLDISYNLVSTAVGMGTRLTAFSDEQFMRLAFTRPRSVFITSTAAARTMQERKSGVIMALTASVSRNPQPQIGGFGVGCAAIESFCKQLALEVGPDGVRVVVLRTGGTPDNPVLQEVYQKLAEVRGTTKEAVEKAEAQHTALKRSPRTPEVARAAVLLASDYASAITATPVNASAGELVD